jgi:hypothetical protein
MPSAETDMCRGFPLFLPESYSSFNATGPQPRHRAIEMLLGARAREKLRNRRFGRLEAI